MISLFVLRMVGLFGPGSFAVCFHDLVVLDRSVLLVTC